MRYIKCKKCGKPFLTKSTTPNPRHSPPCSGYGDEISYEQFVSMSNPNEPQQVQEDKDKTSDEGFTIQIDQQKSVMDSSVLEATSQSIQQNTPNQSTMLDSALGASLILIENTVFTFTDRDPLTDPEKDLIRDSAQRVSQKYQILQNLQYGSELELGNAVISPILNRRKKKNANPTKREVVNSRKDGMWQDISLEEINP